MKNLRATLAPLCIGLLLALVLIEVKSHDQAPGVRILADLINKLELRLLDYRYVLRDQYPIKPIPLSPDIAMVLVDEDSLDRIRDPEVFWIPYYAEVASGVLQAGAKVVGLDYLLSYSNPKLAEKFGLMMLPYRGRMVPIAALGQDERTGADKPVLPNDIYLAIVGVENVGLANLTRDLDGIERAQEVVAIKSEAMGRGQWQYFPALLAERFRDREINADSGKFGGTELPLFDKRLLINYTGPSADKVFPTYSFYKVLDLVRQKNQAELERLFQGKVVLVGPGSKASGDVVETPFSIAESDDPRSAHKSTLGIEVQANVLNTLLTGAFLRRWSVARNNCVLVVVCLLTAFVAYRLSVPASTVCGVGLAMACCFAAIRLFSANGLWIDLGAPLLSIPLVWGSTYSYRYAVEEREKHFIRSAFGRYVSHDVMEELLDDPDKLSLKAAQKRELTVLFVDINGFTSIAECRAPEVVIDMLNDYFAEMTKIVFNHKGTVEKFVGDEMMVVFGAPRPHPEPEKAAVRTALDMVAKLRELEAQDPSKDQDPARVLGFYRIKVGIHTGQVILGNIGTEERMQYTAIGDTVNLASRIMSLTKQIGGNILLSDATYEKAKGMDGVEFVYKESQEVRGRQSKIPIYEARLPQT